MPVLEYKQTKSNVSITSETTCIYTLKSLLIYFSIKHKKVCHLSSWNSAHIETSQNNQEWKWNHLIIMDDFNILPVVTTNFELHEHRAGHPIFCQLTYTIFKKQLDYSFTPKKTI